MTSKSTHCDENAPEPVTAAGHPLLRADDVDFAYGAVTVLEDVSITIEAGEVTALIGPNGTGKTTLLRALAGLQEPTAGTIRYVGPDATRPIGYLPQHPAFRPGFTVTETLEFYASLVGPATDAGAKLDLVGLGAATDRPVEALSGGMTRLLGIAQATIGDPPVVALDEPASGLDPGMSARVFEIAGELTETETGVLVTSHDLELVERTATTVVLLDQGEIVARGPPAALVDDAGGDSLRDVYEVSVSGPLDTVSVRGGVSQ